MLRIDLQRKAGEAYGSWYWADNLGKSAAEKARLWSLHEFYERLAPLGDDELDKLGNILYRGQDADRRMGIHNPVSTSRYDRLAEWECHPTYQDADYFGVYINRNRFLLFT